MTTLQLTIICATVLLLAAISGFVQMGKEAAATPRSDLGLGSGLLPGQRIAAHMRDGQSIEGVVTGALSDLVILNDAVLRTPNQSDTGLGGNVRVALADATALQELTGVEATG